MVKEKEPSDAEWLRARRLRELNEKYFWEKLQKFGAWIAGTFATLWASFDAFTKFMEWLKK